MTHPSSPPRSRTPSEAPAGTVRDPVPAAVVQGLRREAYQLLRSDSRRVDFPTTLRVGRLDRWPSPLDACQVPRAPEPVWAAEVLEALLLDRATPAQVDVWVVRPGEPVADHLDDRWARALHEVVEAHALALPTLYVVTRTGWFRHDDGQGQRWERLRLVLPPT